MDKNLDILYDMAVLGIIELCHNNKIIIIIKLFIKRLIIKLLSDKIVD